MLRTEHRLVAELEQLSGGVLPAGPVPLTFWSSGAFALLKMIEDPESFMKVISTDVYQIIC